MEERIWVFPYIKKFSLVYFLRTVCLFPVIFVCLWPRTLHLWSPNMWRFPPTRNNSLQHQVDVLQFNSILTVSTGRELRFHKLRAQSHKSVPAPPPCPQPPHTSEASWKPGYHLRFWPTSYRLDVPMTLSLGLIKLLEWLRELMWYDYHMISYHMIGYDKGYRWTAR